MTGSSSITTCQERTANYDYCISLETFVIGLGFHTTSIPKCIKIKRSGRYWNGHYSLFIFQMKNRFANISKSDQREWKHFPRYWPVVREIYRSPVNSPRKGQWRGALMLSLICAWINGWVKNHEAGDLRCHLAHYDVIVMDNPELNSPQFLHATTADLFGHVHECDLIIRIA